MNIIKALNNKKTVTAIVTGALLTAVALPSAYAADVPGFSATYRINAEGATGTATRTLTKTGNNYKYTVSGSAARIATLNQTSNFRLANGNIAPSNASMSARILGIGNTHSVRFNNAGKSVVSTYKGKSTTLSMPRQAYDDLAMEVQIRQELLNGRFTGRYPLVKRSEIENTVFRQAGSSRISVPAGSYSVVRIDRVHNDRNRATSFWLAPSLNYLPVKIVQNADGKTMSMELTRVN